MGNHTTPFPAPSPLPVSLSFLNDKLSNSQLKFIPTREKIHFLVDIFSWFILNIVVYFEILSWYIWGRVTPSTPLAAQLSMHAAIGNCVQDYCCYCLIGWIEFELFFQIVMALWQKLHTCPTKKILKYFWCDSKCSKLRFNLCHPAWVGAILSLKLEWTGLIPIEKIRIQTKSSSQDFFKFEFWT